MLEQDGIKMELRLNQDWMKKDTIASHLLRRVFWDFDITKEILDLSYILVISPEVKEKRPGPVRYVTQIKSNK